MILLPGFCVERTIFIFQELEKPPPDELEGLRVHSWVLVLHGKREVVFSISRVKSLFRFTLGFPISGAGELFHRSADWADLSDYTPELPGHRVAVESQKLLGLHADGFHWHQS